MAKVELRPDMGELIKGITEKTKEAVSASIRETLEYAEAVMRDEVPKRTGKLESSIYADIREFSGEVVVGARYASKVDKGGSIRSSNWMKVPVSAEAKNGAHLSGLVCVTSKKGNHILAARTRSGLKPHYVLKHEVTLKPNGFLERTSNQVAEKITEIALRNLSAELEK